MATQQQQQLSDSQHANGVSSQYNHATIPATFIGLNTIDVAPDSKVKSFIKEHGGHTVISSVSYKTNTLLLA